MENPYQPPKSNLITNKVILHRKVVWKIFSILMITLYAWMIIVFHDPFNIISEFSNIGVITDLIVYPVVLVGLFGYAWNKKILVPGFWSLIICVELAVDFYRLYNSDIMENIYFIAELNNLSDMAGDQGVAFLKWLMIMGFIISMKIFHYIALYRYANQSPEIWNLGT